jgi:hypothetical protein
MLQIHLLNVQRSMGQVHSLTGWLETPTLWRNSVSQERLLVSWLQPPGVPQVN